MKKISAFFILLFAFSLLLPAQTRAQESWKISEFKSEIFVLDSGVVSVKENINADFGTLDKHGIFRTIPYLYQNKDNTKTFLEFQILGVKRDSETEKYSQSYFNNNLVIKIGDPDKTINGSHNYQIEYTVKGALKGYEKFDELYWNATGNDWPVNIESASAAVVLEKGEPLQESCYQGSSGSTEICKVIETSQKGRHFVATRPLLAGEGLTFAEGYTKGAVPLLVGKAPKNMWDSIFSPFNLISSAFVLLLGLGLISLLWFKKGRDNWFGRNYLFGKDEQKTPIVADETVVVEFAPPENLRPAEIGALLDERADTLDVTATLVDLASRGYLKITEEPKKGIFGSAEYIFDRLDKPTEGLREYEQELLLRLFDSKSSVKLSSLKNKFYKDLAVIKDKLYLDMIDRKFFLESPQKTRLKYSGFAVLVLVVGGGLIWLANRLQESLVLDLAAVVVILGLVFLIVAQFMPRRTALGRQMLARSKGYRLFIDKAEKYRQRFFEQKNLFNEVLPYAIAFGLTEKFAKAFEKMGLETEQPGWYSSPNAFNVIAFSSAMNSFSTTVQSSMASAPSSSGSGGGGFSGGGFGGGGGGSW